MRVEEILIDNIPGISKGTASFLSENAVVCLSRQKHHSGVEMKCHGINDQPEVIEWVTLYTDQMNRSHNDQEVATEYGAVCISILYALHHTDYTIVQRSRKKTGFDYWLGNKNDILFQNAARLEVSGIFDGEKMVQARVQQKLKQVGKSDNTGLQAYISVVEFSQPSISFVKK